MVAKPFDNRYRLIALGELMEPVTTAILIDLGSLVGEVEANWEDPNLARWERSHYAERMQAHQAFCDHLGLVRSAEIIRQIIRLLTVDRGPRQLPYAVLHSLTADLKLALDRELRAVLLLYVPAPDAHAYREPFIGWTAALERFPEIALDVEEAVKCLALHRHTAAVFHAMRVLEHGLRALADRLGLPFDEANWGAIIDRVLKAVAAINCNSHGTSWRETQRTLAEACAHLNAVRVTWRNRVMHVHESFDLERATRAIDSTRIFMDELSRTLKSSP